MRRVRRQRPTFSREQRAVLEEEYSGTGYISNKRRRELATRLHLSESQIKIWFQNRRAKDKRIEKAATDQFIRYGASKSKIQILLSFSTFRYLTIAGHNFPHRGNTESGLPDSLPHGPGPSFDALPLRHLGLGLNISCL